MKINLDPGQEQNINETQLKNGKSRRREAKDDDIRRSGVSKSSGIDNLIECNGKPLDQTMAFGVGGNDIKMIEHVHLGVAMGNAVDSAKQAADYVTDPVDDDGISNALYRFGVL